MNKLSATKAKDLLEKRRLYEMSARQRSEKHELERAHEEELREFNGFWNSKEKEQEEDGKRALGEMDERHKEEIRNLIKELERTLPSKVKESV